MILNIRNNITNYLFDKEYLICMYNDYLYIQNYSYLTSFRDTEIIISIKDNIIFIKGDFMTIEKITKEELLLKGVFKSIEYKDE